MKAAVAEVFDAEAMPKVLRRIVVLALRHRLLVAGAIGSSLLAAVAGLTLPKLYGRAVDQAQHLLAHGAHGGEPTREALVVTAALVVVTAATRGLLTGLSGFMAETCSQKVAYELRLQFFRQLQRLSFSFHDKMHSGELITRGMLDLEATRGFIQGGMMQSLTLLLLIVSAATLMVATDARMAALALAFVPIAGFALTRMGMMLRVAWLKVQQTMSALTLTIEENLQGVRVVRAFAGKAFEMVKFDRAADETLQESFNRINLRLRASATMNLSFYSSMALLLWYGGHQVMAHRITVGRLTEFLTYMTMLQAPIRQITLIVSQASRTTSSGGRLFEILDLVPAIFDPPGAQPLAAKPGVVRFEGVEFAYEPGKPVLRDINFEVGPGQTLGIVGPPGSGKSTIANLIPRFYDVTGGRITINGQDVRSVTLASLRTYVGLVQQEAFLFDETVRSNVAYADPVAEDDRVYASAQAAQIHDYIEDLPLRYESRVGERGVALSGGQRQRMSIARGLTPRPGVLVFDDSTAAVDAVTERKVRDAIAAAGAARTVIIISHRLSALRHADEILVLDEGRIVERGDHASLLKFGGVYAELHALQSRPVADASDAMAPA